MATKRNYAQEYANYDGTEKVKKKRAQRNKARRMLEREGVVHKGDGKDANRQRVAKAGEVPDQLPGPQFPLYGCITFRTDGGTR